MKTLVRTAVMLLASALSTGALASEPKAHETLPADAVQASDSVYLLGGNYLDQDGKKVGLDTFRGHPVLISMFYGSCPHACPMLITDLKRIERSLPADQQGDVRVLLVSFDPKRDTPAAMKGLMEAHGVDANRWKMVQTDPAKVAEVAAVLGIKYRFAPGGGINHSSVITLLDRNGVPVERLEGLRQPEAPVVAKVASMK